MTHEELLAKIHKAYLKGHTGYMSNALRAVVELHKPIERGGLFGSNDYCAECIQRYESWVYYPCPTIQAIEKELK